MTKEYRVAWAPKEGGRRHVGATAPMALLEDAKAVRKALVESGFLGEVRVQSREWKDEK